MDEPDLWLASTENGGWASPRAVALGRVAIEGAGVRGYWAELDSSGPQGENHVILAPRYADDAIDPLSETPLIVDIWVSDRPPNSPVTLDNVSRAAIGELYDSLEAAEAALAKW